MIVAGRVASNLSAPYSVRFGEIAVDIGMEILLVRGDTPPVALLEMAEKAIDDTRRRRGA